MGVGGQDRGRDTNGDLKETGVVGVVEDIGRRCYANCNRSCSRDWGEKSKCDRNRALSRETWPSPDTSSGSDGGHRNEAHIT